MRNRKYISPQYNVFETASIASALKNYHELLLKAREQSDGPDAQLESEIRSTESALNKARSSLDSFYPGLPI